MTDPLLTSPSGKSLTSQTGKLEKIVLKCILGTENGTILAAFKNEDTSAKSQKVDRIILY